MGTTLNIDAGHLNLAGGIQQAAPAAGFLVAPVPRRTARGRNRDQLLLGLSVRSRNGPQTEAYEALLALAAQHYYGTPGSVTAAARAAINAANADLLDANRSLPTGGPLQAGLSCAVLRGNELYLAQAGLGCAFVLHRAAAERFPEMARELRTLGVAHSPEIQYFHTTVGSGDFLLLCHAAPQGWQASTLRSVNTGTLEPALSRLINLAGSAATALVTRFVEPGTACELAESLASLQRRRIQTTQPSGEPAPVPASDPSRLAAVLARVRAATDLGDETVLTPGALAEMNNPDAEVPPAPAAPALATALVGDSAESPDDEVRSDPRPAVTADSPTAAPAESAFGRPALDPVPPPDEWIELPRSGSPSVPQAPEPRARPQGRYRLDPEAPAAAADRAPAREDMDTPVGDEAASHAGPAGALGEVAALFEPADDEPLDAGSDDDPEAVLTAAVDPGWPPEPGVTVADDVALQSDADDPVAKSTELTRGRRAEIESGDSWRAPPPPAQRVHDHRAERAAGGKGLRHRRTRRGNAGVVLARSLRDWFISLPLERVRRNIDSGLTSLSTSLAGSGRNLFGRLTPSGAAPARGRDRFPNSMLIALAVVVPVVVVLTATAIYIQEGQSKQIDIYLSQARLEAGQARIASDQLAAKPHWEMAIEWLDRADALRPGNPDAIALRREALGVLDRLNGVVRVGVAGVTAGGFHPTAHIAEVLVNGSELYAFDSAHQRVHRAVLTTSGNYELDRGFQCSQGAVNEFVIRDIVDIAWLGQPNVVRQEALLALDSTGILLYCPPDGSAPAASALLPPAAGLVAPKAIELYADRLYVLDPGANQIWIYDRAGDVFSEAPEAYFSTDAFDLNDVADFAIAQGDMFILRKDGRLIRCVRSGNAEAPTCTENALFTDDRPGQVSGDHLTDVQTPVALVFDPPPEPSLYLIDADNSGAYQLSLWLIFQRQYRPAIRLDQPLAAVAFGSSKEIFFAAGNNVYVGRRP